MPSFECKRCGYTTTVKQNYNKHLNRKIPCPPILGNIPCELMKNNNNESTSTKINDLDKKQHICKYCGGVFSHYQSKWKHEKACKIKIETHNESKLVTKLQNQIDEMKKEIQGLQLQNNLGNNNNNTTISINNTTINLVINRFGDENIEYVTEEYLTKLISSGVYNSISKLIRQIYFNPNHPENRNIKITNKKLNYASVFNRKWELRDRKEIVENIVNKGYNIIDDHYICIQNELAQKYKDRYQKYSNEFNDDTNNVRKEQMKKVDLLILNES